MWRKLRRIVGYWIAGAEPPLVHCSNCAHVTSAYCTMHRDAIRAAMRTAEMPRVHPLARRA